MIAVCFKEAGNCSEHDFTWPEARDDDALNGYENCMKDAHA